MLSRIHKSETAALVNFPYDPTLSIKFRFSFHSFYTTITLLHAGSNTLIGDCMPLHCWHKR